MFHSRQQFVAALGVAVSFGLASVAFAGPDGNGGAKDNHDKGGSVAPIAALVRLTAGNKRFAEGTVVHANQDAARRSEVAKGQKPFAMILTCSDSRVPPEVVFDQGLGDLFIVRNAGNGADLSALASMQYAVGHLGPRLLVIMGHEKCGAVAAAMAGEEAVKDEPEELRDLLKTIRPSIASVPAGANKDETASKSVEANVRANVARFMASPGFKALAEKHNIQVVGAVYDLETGKIRFLNDK